MPSHRQTRATHLVEEDEVQVQCVSCIMALIKRKPGMEAVLARPHAVTCLLAALELKSRRVQREVRARAAVLNSTSCHTPPAHSTS